MAAQKMTVFFTFLVLFAFMEEANLAMTHEVIICEHKGQAISCGPNNQIINVLDASYGRHDRDTCPDLDQYTSNTNCHAGNSHAIVGFICGYKNYCELWANNSVFGDWCEGTYKYLRVEYQCVDLFVLCEGSIGTLSCPEGKPIKVLQASYGRHDRTTCQALDVYMTNTNCHAENTHTIVQEECHHKPSCVLNANNTVFGDPCPGTYKYLRVMYECGDVFVLCDGTFGTLSCPEGKLIKVLSVSYGRHDRTTCQTSESYMTNTNCHAENNYVMRKCHGKPRCQLYASKLVFGDPCPGTHKYLRVMYDCL